VDKAVFQLLDDHAASILRSASLVTSAIEGAYSRTLREDPSVRGLQAFLRASDYISDLAAELIGSDLRSFVEQAGLFVQEYETDTRSIALQQVHTSVETLRLSAARRFKAAIVGRRSVVPPIIALRVLNRAGRRIAGEEMLFLQGRQTLIDLFNESQIAKLHLQGQRLAMVHHADEEHQLHGAIIAINSAQAGIPSYEDVHGVWFHPRSRALLGTANVHSE
jgi:hypothetical protein